MKFCIKSGDVSTKSARNLLLVLGVMAGLMTGAVACVMPGFLIKPEAPPFLTQDLSLPSGLRVLVREDRTQPLISVVMLVGSGSSADPIQKEGTAHLLEHLWFRSRHGTLPPVEEAHQQLGAVANAFTSPDLTTFITVAPPDALLPLMRLEALRLDQPLQGIDHPELVAEREVVRQELRQRYDDTAAHGLKFLYNKLFPASHPYHRLSNTTHLSLDSVEMVDLQTYAATHYKSDNVTLMVTGALTVEQVAKALQETFPTHLLADPRAPDAPIRRIELKARLTGPAEEPPPPSDASLAVVKGRVERPTLLLAWSLPGAFRNQDALMQLATQVLNTQIRGGINSRVSMVTNRYGEYNRSQCVLIPGVLASTVLCTITVGDDQKPERVLDAAIDSIRAFFGPTRLTGKRSYLEMLRWQARALLLTRAEELLSVDGYAVQAASWAHFRADPVYLSRLEQEFATVSDNAINGFGYRYFSRDRVASVLVEPMEPGLLPEAAGEGTKQIAPRGGVVNPSGLLASLTPDQLQQMVVSPNLDRMHTFTLENGLQVVLMPHGARGFARSTLVFRGGSAFERIPGGILMARSLQRKPDSLSQQLFSIGAEWEERYSPIEQQLAISSSSGNVAEQLYILRDRITLARVDTSFQLEFTHFLKTALEHEQQRLEARESAVWLPRLLPAHWMAQRTLPADLDSLERTPGFIMEGWLRQIFQPQNATLFVVGSIDPVLTERHVRTYLGSWRGRGNKGEPAFSLAPPPAPPARQILLLDRQDALVTRVQLHCQLAPATLERYEGLQVLAELSDRLIENRLRTELAAAYSTSATLQLEPGGTSLLHMRTTVPNAQAETALATFFDLTDRLHTTPPDAVLLNQTKAALARHYALEQHSNEQMTYRLMEPTSLGLGWELIRGYGERLAAVGPQALPPLLDRCSGHEVVTLIGPVKTLEPQLRQAGLKFELLSAPQ